MCPWGTEREKEPSCKTLVSSLERDHNHESTKETKNTKPIRGLVPFEAFMTFVGYRSEICRCCLIFLKGQRFLMIREGDGSEHIRASTTLRSS